VSNPMHDKTKTKPRKGDPKPGESQWLGFVDIPLSDADKARIPELGIEGERAFNFLEEMIEDGYKITLSQDKKHSCYIATATGQHTESGNDGYSLSGRGPSTAGAVAALAYKHICLCERGSWGSVAVVPTNSAYG